MNDQSKPAIPEAELAKLRAIHGDVFVTEQSGRVFGVVPAPEAICDRIFDINYTSRLGGTVPKGIAEAYANAAALSVVYPPAAERDALFGRYRQLQIMLGTLAYGLSNGPREEEKKEEPISSSSPKTT